MLITISSSIIITQPNDLIKQYCKDKLVFKNPDYDKKRRMGIWLGGTPKQIKLYDIYNDEYYLPIGCFYDIWALHPDKDDYIDYSISKKVNIKSNIKLREYQLPCVKAIKENYTGLFILPAGTGKTLTALHCVSELGQKTLWLTHTKDLLNQAKTECESNMVCTTSVISDGKCDYSGDIVFATVQTLVNVIDKMDIPQTAFGCVIADECHHSTISAEKVMQFQKCINYFASRYKIGLTATLHTSNGLHVTIPKLLGNIIYELKKENDVFNGYYKGKKVVSVPANQFQVPAIIHLIKSSYVPTTNVYDVHNGTMNFSTLITEMSQNEERNKLILHLLSTINGSTIVVGDRTEQLENLANKLGTQAVFVSGKTKKKERENGLEKVKKGEVKFLFATYKLIAEGFNAPILENLIMATPVKDLRIVVQSIGRVQRPYKNKKVAHVYDIIDDIGRLDKFLKSRKNIYKKEGYEIHGQFSSNN